MTGNANLPPNSDLEKERQGQCFSASGKYQFATQLCFKDRKTMSLRHCWMGMPKGYSIMILKEKGKFNHYVLAGNANVPRNSDLKREMQC
jgi:hypothetical protein